MDSIWKFIYKKITKTKTPIIINSYGRSGSTMLFHSIADSSINKKIFLKKRSVKGGRSSAWNLNSNKIEQKIIYKSHDYPPKKSLASNTKFIYVFSDPIDVITSIIKLTNTSKWNTKRFQQHCKHLKTKCTNISDLTNEDQLNLEKHFDAWLNEKRFPIAFVRYEKLWDNIDKISSFIGFQVSLPPFRKRVAQEKKDIETINQLKKTYATLYKKLKECEDFFIINNK